MEWQNGDKLDKMLPPAIKTNYLRYLLDKRIKTNWFSLLNTKTFMDASSVVFALSLLYLNWTKRTIHSPHYSVPMK